MYLLRTLIALFRGRICGSDGKSPKLEDYFGVVFWFLGFGLSAGMLFAYLGHLLMHGSLAWTVIAGIIGLVAGAEGSCYFLWKDDGSDDTNNNKCD